MSALEIIEQIKALPPEEKAQVADFVRNLAVEKAETPEVRKTIRYASSEQAKAAGHKVLSQYEEVFRRLSQ